MRSIIDIYTKNFQEDHTNSRRFPGGFLNSSRFQGFPGVVDTLLYAVATRNNTIKIQYMGPTVIYTVNCKINVGQADKYSFV